MKPTVLIVDDEQVFRVLAESALVAEGFEVRSASNLARARKDDVNAAIEALEPYPTWSCSTAAYRTATAWISCARSLQTDSRRRS